MMVAPLPKLPLGAATGAGERAPDFVLTPEDLERISRRGRDLLGLELGEAKRQLVYSRLSKRLRALGLRSFGEYVDLLDTAAGAAEREHFANALTTNLTSFFREVHHFDHLEREIRAQPDRRLRIWSAGCSTGEEAYTIAMILAAAGERPGGGDRRILATDIDSDALATAIRGRYARDRLRLVPARFHTPAFFEACERDEVVTEMLRRLVVFRKLNLIGAWPFRTVFDMIFCRNVLIYFSPELRARLVERFIAQLAPGGLLYLGHSESVLGNHPKLAAEGHTIYRRLD
jgi:chemotaxis protein methyltransferase CheR